MVGHCENDPWLDPHADLIEHLDKCPEIVGVLQTTMGSAYIEAARGCNNIELDGEFGIKDLEAILAYMRAPEEAK